MTGRTRRLGAERARPRRRRRARRARRRARAGAVGRPPSRGAARRRRRSQRAHAAPRTTSRGSTAWSPGTSSAARSGRRQRGLQRGAPALGAALDGEAERLAQRALALERLGLVAVAGDDERAARAVADAHAAAASSSAAKAGQRARAVAGRGRSSSRSPASASVTGASMPGGDVRGPAPSARRARGARTRRPARAARHATARPTIPPPTTATSLVLRSAHLTSLRRHDPDQLRRSAAAVPPSQPRCCRLP